ncbi:MAG: glycogen debranching N-terminal domain-containing protein, partial [Spirochaetaceae bacterium]
MNTDNYISEGALMAVFTATGTIDGAVTHGSGVYAGDTRFLTRLTAHLANIGARHTQKESGPGWADFRFFARRPGSSERVDLVLTFSYRLHAPGVLVLTAELLNASQTRYHDTLRVETESSFDDIFEVRDAVEGVLGIFLQ